MVFAGLNYLAIVIAAVAGFMFGGAWYTMLSGQWLAAVGKSADEIKRSTRSMPVLLATTLAAQLIMAWVLAGVIGHLGPGQVTIRNGLISAAFNWVGFVATTLVVNHGYGGQKPSLTLIDGAHWLGVLLIQGFVIGAFGVR
jgi:hypothetical protein